MNVRKGFPTLPAVLVGMLCVCGGLPHSLFLTCYGRMPLGSHQKPFEVPLGSTTAMTRDMLGRPHDRQERDDGTQIWYYHGDPLGLVIYSMKFDAEGRLENAWW